MSVSYLIQVQGYVYIYILPSIASASKNYMILVVRKFTPDICTHAGDY